MDLRSLSLGNRVKIYFPFGIREAELVAIIGAGGLPHPEEVTLWYGPNAPESVFRRSKVDRYIFRKPSGHFIIVPDSEYCAKLVRKSD